MTLKRDGRGLEVGLELPFGHLIRGITRSRSPVEREEAAAAYLLALAGQRHADRPEDRLAVAAMAARTRKELLHRSSLTSRGPILERLAEALVAGAPAACVEALLALAEWYEERARDEEAREVVGVARALVPGVEDAAAIRVCRAHGSLALRCARWKEALDAFRFALRLSRRAGCRASEMRCALGLAWVELGRGRVTRARGDAARVAAAAGERGDAEVLGLAFQTLFAVEQRARDFDRALEHGWRALHTYERSEARARLLVDCGRLFADLGARGTARRVYEAALARPLPMRERLAAAVGLLELEVEEGNEVAFAGRRKALEGDPDLAEVPFWHARFWVVVGRGYGRFGKGAASERALDEAAWLVEWNGLDPVLLNAEWDLEPPERGAEADDRPALEELARRFSGSELG